MVVLPACASVQSQAPDGVISEPGTAEIVPLANHTVGADEPPSTLLFNCTPLTRGRVVIPPADLEEPEDQAPVEAPVEDPISAQKIVEVELPYEAEPALNANDYLAPSAVANDGTSVEVLVPVDPLKLTHWSEKTGLGGKQMYDLYARMWADKTGWWWQAFGEDGYTVWDFLSTFSYYEASGYVSWAEVMAEAGVRWYYETGSFYGTPGSIEAVLNWWGAFSQSTADVYFAGPNYVLSLPWKATLTDIEGMKIVGNSFETPPDAWTLGFDAERPFGWGNMYICYSDKDLLTERRRLMLSQPDALFIYFGNGETAFVIPSGCAWATGYNLWYDNRCSKVMDYTYARAE